MYIMGFYLSMPLLVALILAVLIMWALLIVGHWTMFQKAGEKGWKALVPIYSDYIVFKTVWTVRSFWIYFLLVTVSIVATSNVMQDGSAGITGIISWIASFAMTVWAIITSAKTAQAFGKGPQYAFGLVLLPGVFAAIIGLGSAEYRGPQ